MIREQIETGKTVELAVEAACQKLEISKDDAQYEILEMPKKGFLGFGATPAKVRVYIEMQLKDLIRDGESEDNSLQS